MNYDLINNSAQTHAARVDYYPVSHQDSEFHAEQNGNLQRHEVSMIEDRVQCQICFLNIKDQAKILYLWKRASRHYRGGQEAGRATNQPSIHQVR